MLNSIDFYKGILLRVIPVRIIVPCCDSDLGGLINRLEHDSVLTIEWFESSYMKLNDDKCHFLLSGCKHEMMLAKIGQSRIWESEKQKLLGVTIDKHLKFEEHIVKQCKKAGQKLSALARVCIILNQERQRTLMKAFIESQFGYCPLFWMLCRRNLKSVNYIPCVKSRSKKES